MNKKVMVLWGFKVILAGLYLMMSIPKFAGQDVTIHIFSTLGVEPWGRYFTGIIELSTFVLILIPATAIYGIILSLGVLLGALLSHLTILGIVVQNSTGTINDGGEIFATALIMLSLTLLNLYLNRRSIPLIGNPS